MKVLHAVIGAFLQNDECSKVMRESLDVRSRLEWLADLARERTARRSSTNANAANRTI
jgi:hypothetical protein